MHVTHQAAAATRPHGERITHLCEDRRTVAQNKAANIDEMLRCAQILFAQRGYDITSLREVAQAAGVALGTVSLYFGTKEALFQALVERATRAVNAERLALFNAERAPDRTALEHVVHAINWPVVRLANSEDPLERTVPRLMRRAHTGPVYVERTMRRELDPVSRQLLAGIMDSCPGLSHDAALWGYSMLIGALYSRQLLEHRHDELLPDHPPQLSAQECCRLIDRFGVAALLGLARG